MMSLSLRRSIAAMALLAGAIACSEDPIGPVATMPVSAAELETLADALAPFGTDPVLSAYWLPGFARGLPFDEDFSPFVPLSRDASSRTSATSARRERMAPVAQRTSLPLTIPDSLKGLTFLPDSIGYGYVLDTLTDGRPRPGAPADGVRFMIAPLLTLTIDPVIVGYVDLRQQGTAAAPTFTADMYDLAGTHVMHHEGSPVAISSAGWSMAGGRRIEQSSMLTRPNRQTRWTWSVSSTPLDVTREDGALDDAIRTRHSLTLGDRRLHLVSIRNFGTTRTTYTVLVGDAPFARREDVTFTPGTWQHLRDDRPLTADEQAQVSAFVRVLAMLPDSEMMFGRVMSHLFFLLRPINF